MKLEVFSGNNSSSNFTEKPSEVCSDAEGILSGEEELGSDGDCVANSPEPSTPGTDGKSKPYTRRPKPPYSYIALIAMAIRDSASGRLTLAEINDYLMKKFPFFRGAYTGWRNSVRHNLSLNDCFLKVLRDPSRPWGKDNYWMLNPNSEYTFADGVFRRRRKRINKKPTKEQEGLDLPVGEEPSTNIIPAIKDDASNSKFTSSFAIDSILSRPFKRKEDSPHEVLVSPSQAGRVFWTGGPSFVSYLVPYSTSTVSQPVFPANPTTSHLLPAYRYGLSEPLRGGDHRRDPSATYALGSESVSTSEVFPSIRLRAPASCYHSFKIDSLLA
ncbi:forkhead box protein Q1a [Erpetoichthys calabaricus]|uniref:forkhead box protein Q1a n=1 Tax=Erpetoichthys calabaricus TaxID=27687 RepID=UPI00109FA04E|nr:forkhead box protein Q1a [Erpetoichthys calabaricus]